MANTYVKKVSTWARPKEILESAGKSGEVNLWGTSGIIPGGVQQGNLGDCWFLAAAAALAEYPERIERIFSNVEHSNEGVYEVILYLNGSPVKEVVDDYLPVN